MKNTNRTQTARSARGCRIWLRFHYLAGNGKWETRKVEKPFKSDIAAERVGEAVCSKRIATYETVYA